MYEARQTAGVFPSFSDTARHIGGDGFLRLRLGLGGPALRERHRREQRPAPRAEVLDREVLPHVLRGRTGSGASRSGSRARRRRCGSGTGGRRPGAAQSSWIASASSSSTSAVRTQTLCLPRKSSSIRLPRTFTWLLPQRRDPVGPGLLRVALRAGPKPAEVDQPERDRRDPLAVEVVAVHVLGHRRADRGQPLAEADELVELRLLLPCAVRLGGRGTASARPCRRRSPGASLPGAARSRRRATPAGFAALDPLELLGVGELATARVDVPEAPALRAAAAPPSPSCHSSGVTRGSPP